MAELRPILLVEDNPRDIELTLAALEENRLANEVIVVRDGEEALDYLLRRGIFTFACRGESRGRAARPRWSRSAGAAEA